MTNNKRRSKHSKVKNAIKSLVVSSGKNLYNCSHDYCMAKQRNMYGSEEDFEDQKPVGLPWASGRLKYLPGQLKVKFPLRKKSVKPKKISLPDTQTRLEPCEKLDEIHNPKLCGVFDEMIYAYKVFILAGLVISEAKSINEDEESISESSLS